MGLESSTLCASFCRGDMDVPERAARARMLGWLFLFLGVVKVDRFSGRLARDCWFFGGDAGLLGIGWIQRWRSRLFAALRPG